MKFTELIEFPTDPPNLGHEPREIPNISRNFWPARSVSHRISRKMLTGGRRSDSRDFTSLCLSLSSHSSQPRPVLRINPQIDLTGAYLPTDIMDDPVSPSARLTPFRVDLTHKTTALNRVEEGDIVPTSLSHRRSALKQYSTVPHRTLFYALWIASTSTSTTHDSYD